MLQNERGWTIVIDDYVSRPQYKVIADFAEIDHYVVDRIAVFTSAKAASAEFLESAISWYETEPY